MPGDSRASRKQAGSKASRAKADWRLRPGFWAVPVEQAQLFVRKLRDSGNDPIMVLVKNANHNFKPTGGAISPSRSEISLLMGTFFDSILIGQ